MTASGVCEQKAEQGMFSPVAIVAAGSVRLCEEGAVAAMLGLEKRDVRVCLDLFATLGSKPDERIIQRMQDQGRHGDAIEHAGSSSAMVVIICTSKPGVERIDMFVEVAQGADSGGAIR